MLYYLLQRYKFESNSQRIAKRKRNVFVVLSVTKIQIWKQFTTSSLKMNFLLALYYLLQRYKFESNSQRDLVDYDNSNSCIICYKDTNLKAIHNMQSAQAATEKVVLSVTKIQIWKQFTTSLSCFSWWNCCIICYKDTNLKAIHKKISFWYCFVYSILSNFAPTRTIINIAPWKNYLENKLCWLGLSICWSGLMPLALSQVSHLIHVIH